MAICYQGRVAAEVKTSLVTMKASDDQWLRWYVATGEPHGKAGAYGIQGAAAVFVDSVQGSVTNVIGLPLSLLEQLLAEVGVSLLRLLTP